MTETEFDPSLSLFDNCQLLKKLVDLCPEDQPLIVAFKTRNLPVCHTMLNELRTELPYFYFYCPEYEESPDNQLFGESGIYIFISSEKICQNDQKISYCPRLHIGDLELSESCSQDIREAMQVVL
jgi:hypothetical protein